MTYSKNIFKISKLVSLLQIAITALLCVSVAFIPHDADAKTKSKKSKNRSAAQSKPYNPPYAHIVLDAATGRVLYQSDADRALYPASLTKVMTLVMVFEALESKKINLNSPVLFTSRAANMPPSRLGIKPGRSITVETAIKALVTKSANDVAAALGEKLGGSEARFAQLMNLKARQIGMAQTHFENASGLHNVRQVSSARDMAKLAIHLMNTYPRYYKYFALREFSYDGKTYKNHNHLMSTYRGMDGLKTGYIYPSGFNLIASAKRGNTRLIGVIFGGKTTKSRNTQMASLLDSGFAGKRLNTTYEQSTPDTSVQSRDAILKLDPPSRPPKPFEKTAPQSAGLKKPTIGEGDNRTAQSTPLTYQNGWAVQIGAYQDRVSTDQALYRAISRLPAPLNRGNAMVIPLRTADSTWVFRARIAGYTRDQAIEACKHLKDCLTVSPNAN